MKTTPSPSSGKTHPTEDRIRERAYFLWLERGCPDGESREHWFIAERLLSAADESTPAEKSPETGAASSHFSIKTTVAAHLSDPAHRFHGPGAVHDGRLDVIAGEARQRVRGRRFGGSLRSRPKKPE